MDGALLFFLFLWSFLFCGLPVLVLYEFLLFITNEKEIIHPFIFCFLLSFAISIILIFFMISGATGEAGLAGIAISPFFVICSLFIGLLISSFYKIRNKPILPRKLQKNENEIHSVSLVVNKIPLIIICCAVIIHTAFFFIRFNSIFHILISMYLFWRLFPYGFAMLINISMKRKRTILLWGLLPVFLIDLLIMSGSYIPLDSSILGVLNISIPFWNLVLILPGGMFLGLYIEKVLEKTHHGIKGYFLCIAPLFLIFLVLLAARIYIFSWNGTVVDSSTHKPVSGTVLARKWVTEYPTPAGSVSSDLALNETLSDGDGTFSIPFKERFFVFGIPVIIPITDRTVVYKPGYKFHVPKKGEKTIELEKVPTSMELRKAELEKFDNFDFDPYINFNRASLLDIVNQKEREFIESSNIRIKKIKVTEKKEKTRSRSRKNLRVPDHPLSSMSTDQLINLLSNPNNPSQKQREAVTALGFRSDPKIFDVLSQVITENRHGVAFRAVEVLARHPNQKTYELLVKSLPNQYGRASSILIDIGPPALKPLINSLESDDSKQRKYSALVLGRIYSSKSLSSLIKILETDEDSSVRKNAAISLAKLNDSRALDPLIKAWGDEDLDVRREVSRALVSFGKRAIKPLTKIMLEHDEVYFRWRAAWCLGRINDSTAEDDLIKALKDEAPEVQWIAIEALKKVGSDKSEDSLTNMLSAGDIGLSNKAKDALEWIKIKGDKIQERKYKTKKQIADSESLKVIFNEDIKALKDLLSKDPSIINLCQNGWTPLSLTIEGNNLDKAKVLLEEGADPCLTCWITPKKTRRVNTPLHESVKRNLNDFVKLFIEHGADVNKRDDTDLGYTPLIIAVGNKNDELSSYLISKGADPLLELRSALKISTSGGISPLQQALYSKNYKLAKLFLDSLPKKQSGENVVNFRLGTTLSKAHHNKLVYTDVKELIKLGGDPHLRSQLVQSTALQFASRRSDIEFVKYLIAQDVEINTQDRHGKTPLIEAVNNDNLEIVTYLLNKGAAPNPIDAWGKSPLKVAITNNNLVITKLLLASGADASVQDRTGLTPYDVALKNKNEELAKLLSEYMK